MTWGIAGAVGLVLAAVGVGVYAARHTPFEVSLTPVSFDPPDSFASSSGSCVQCHQFEHGMSHPVEVPARMAVPSNLPLENGRVTCFTCHDAPTSHVSAKQRVGVREPTAKLCMDCHANSAAASKMVHARSYGLAHLKAENGLKLGPIANGFDRETKACVSCHDGALSPEIGFHAMKGEGMGDRDDHPMGIPLAQTSRNRESDFRIARVTSPRIRLVEGVIGCGSCHSVYSHEPAQLVMSNRGSQLCLSCHKQ